MLYAIFGVLVIILDQWVKYWTAGNIPYGSEARPLIPGIVNLLNVHNDGAAFSFLSGANAGKIFVILAAVFTVLVIIGIATRFISGKFARWCAVFVAAGGIGNAIDRALYGYVQDMFQFDFLKSFPVFNVADIFICVFCFLFILCIIFGGKKEKREADYDEEYEGDVDAPSSKRSRRAARKAAAEYEEEEPAPGKASRRKAPVGEYEEEEPAPVRRQSPAPAADPEPVYEEEEASAPRLRNKLNTTSHSKTTRKERQSKYDDQFEQYKANRDARQRSAEYSGVSPSSPAFASSVPSYDSADPFAEWEKTNAAISAQKAAQKAPAPERRAERAPQPARVQEETPAAPVAKPAPAEPRQPAPEPAAPAAAPKKAEDEFSLDDILAEFR